MIGNTHILTVLGLALVLVLCLGAAREAERSVGEEASSGFPPQVEFLWCQSDAQPHTQQRLQLW